MRQVNPLIVALFLVLLLAVFVMRLESAKEAYSDTKSDLRKTEAMAERIVALKQSWGDTPQKQKSLQRLLASPQLKKAGIEIKKGRDVTIITANKMEMKSASYLLNKLLNGTYAIEKMDVSQVDNAHLFVKVEVAR